MTRQVDRDGAEVNAELRDDRRPRGVVKRHAVQENDGRADSSLLVSEWGMGSGCRHCNLLKSFWYNVT
jgi:hypothetical protein